MLDDELSVDEKHLLRAMADRADASGWCPATTKTLAVAVELPPKVVSRCIGRLAANRYIVIRLTEGGRECRVVSTRSRKALIRDDRAITTDRPSERQRARLPDRASLSGDLLNRAWSLPTLMREQAAREESAPGDLATNPVSAAEGPDAGSGFDLWLRFVLSPDEVGAFRAWEPDHGAAYTRLKIRFRRARSDGDLESLLEDMLTAIDQGGAPNAGTASRTR